MYLCTALDYFHYFLILPRQSIVQDYLLPELESLQASLGLDMSSRTAEKYTYYLSALRHIVRHFPEEWKSSVKTFVMRHPYTGPNEIITCIDQEIAECHECDRLDVLTAVRILALSLRDLHDEIAETVRA